MIKEFIKKISVIGAKLAPKVEIFGLEISDGIVRFHSLSRGGTKAKDYPVRLLPGVVEGGKVLDQDALEKVLIELHKKVSKSFRKKINVILTIPISNIYLQPFSLPIIAESKLAESADLNMRMISPINIETAYFDWQSVNILTDDEVSMVGGFATKELVDGFINPVQAANFGVAAVEFSSLSLVRATHLLGFAKAERPQFILEISQAGLEFSVSHEGSLYFHYFSAWDHYKEGKTIDTNKLKEGLVNETRKVLNFYSTSFKTSEVKNMIIIGQNFIDEITQSINTNFPGIEVKTATMNEVNAAMGAAYRGKVPRAQDLGISLASFSAIELFHTSQLSNFISIWRNAIVTVFGIFLFAFFGSIIVLQRTALDVVAQDPFKQRGADIQELTLLVDQAKEFNSSISMLKRIVDNRVGLHPLLEHITSLMGTTIDVSKADFNVNSLILTIMGTGVSENAVINFKVRLEEDEIFDNVDLPLSDLKTLSDGSAQFTLKVLVKDLDL